MVVRKGLESYKMGMLEMQLYAISNEVCTKSFIIPPQYISPRMGGPYIYNRYRDQKHQLIKVKTSKVLTPEEIEAQRIEKKFQDLLQMKNDMDYIMHGLYVNKLPKLIARQEKLEDMYHSFHDNHPEFYRCYPKNGL